MRVYDLRPDLKRYCTFAVAGELPQDFYWQFDGRSLAENWKTVTITAADEDDATIELPDFTLLGLIPFFSVRAATVLLPLLTLTQ